MTREYSIGEFSNLIGVTEQTLRNWDKSGKLTSSRGADGMGHRRYNQEQLDRFLGKSKDYVEDKLNVYGYAKMNEQGTPKDYNYVMNPLRKYVKENNTNDNTKILTDIYRPNNRTVDLHDFNTLMSRVQRHQVNKVIFSCQDSTDYYEYKALSNILYRMGVDIVILKNGIDINQELDNITNFELVKNAIEKDMYSRSEMFNLITALENKLDESVETVTIKELD